ncbi:hypothetical protein EDD37DRAFT_691533 [Exophiala viscosa]|uniref:uncharacterized protein n=1 Tax=Exophiala viscosa TaxID=2486360 RepID=UPI0021A0A4E1|nr:hypothetical protein EDD37DRAFT_691533 [Exophiala viscosa]
MDPPLDLHITKWPNSNDDCWGLIEKLWAVASPSTIPDKHIDLSAYSTYHKEQCLHALIDGSIHVLVEKHGNIVEIAKRIAEDRSRDDIRTFLSSKLKDPRPDNEIRAIDSSIDLTARLISMMELESCNMLSQAAKFSTPVVLGHDVKLEKMFNGRNLGRIAGIEIVWTDNLADHLRMSNEDREVAIFHHASFLKHQQWSLFPAGLIDDTLQTLALLFPEADDDTTRWFNRQPTTLNIDRHLIKCGKLKGNERQIERFTFWHDRLVVLKQTFDESRPTTLSQWWCDRRNGVQWYTFWVAILVLLLTVFFGLIQCLEGALQVYKAYHPS